MFIVCHAHFYTNIQSHRPPHNSFSRAAHCRNCVAAKSMIDDIMCRAQSYTKLQSHRPPHNSFSRAAHCRNCIAAKSMIDDIMCCALHPSGTIIAVGLHEKLQLFSIAQVIRFFTSSLLDCMKSCSCSALPRQTVLHAISMQGRGRQT